MMTEKQAERAAQEFADRCQWSPELAIIFARELFTQVNMPSTMMNGFEELVAKLDAENEEFYKLMQEQMGGAI